MTDQPDMPHRRPPDEGPDTSAEPEVRAPGADNAGEMRAPNREDVRPTDPPGQNAPVGESSGAGMGNPATDQPDPSRDRFRETRM